VRWWSIDPDPAADLQPLARNVCLRRRYDKVRCRASIGGRFNCPVPAEMAIFIEIPSSATALCDLYAPMIVVGWNCEYKCNRSRHDHSAQNANEKYAYHFLTCSHSRDSIIEGCCHADSLFRGYLSEAALMRAIIAHSCGLAYRLPQPAEVNSAFFCHLARRCAWFSFAVLWYDQARPEEGRKPPVNNGYRWRQLSRGLQ
jgi:hypothetical protein